MNILIIHGWMHSSKLYERLKEDLQVKEKHKVMLYELPGFGDKPAKYKKNIIESYADDLKVFLKENKYDLVIAHSLGGNVLLRATEESSINRVLLSPEYKGVSLLNFVAPLIPIGVPFLNLMRRVNTVTTFILKLLSLFTINSWDAITDDVVESARKADPHVAIELLKEMRSDTYRTLKSSKMTYLLLGEKDRIIAKKNMEDLCNDLGNCMTIVFKKIGHTAVLEAYSELYDSIKKICERIDNGSEE